MTNMQYEIRPEIRTLAIKLEKERRKKESEKNCTLNSTNTKVQTSSPPERGTEYREELFYREGFKKIWKKY